MSKCKRVIVERIGNGFIVSPFGDLGLVPLLVVEDHGNDTAEVLGCRVMNMFVNVDEALAKPAAEREAAP